MTILSFHLAYYEQKGTKLGEGERDYATGGGKGLCYWRGKGTKLIPKNSGILCSGFLRRFAVRFGIITFGNITFGNFIFGKSSWRRFFPTFLVSKFDAVSNLFMETWDEYY
jgi:hypothetical protein